MNRNSNRNQKIREEFIRQNVLCDISTEVNFILEMGETYPIEVPYRYEEISNYYEDNSEEIKKIDERLEELDAEIWDAMSQEADMLVADAEAEINELEERKAELENSDGKPAEVMEWYKVTKWFAEILLKDGQVVIENNNIWGRCSSGQLIAMDGLIGRLCEELEILEGQDNEWTFI